MTTASLRALGFAVVPVALFLLPVAWASPLQTQPSARSQPAALPPWQRMLTGEDKKRVEELEQRVTELQKAGDYAEALSLAEEVTAIRTRAQGKDHWETVKNGHVVKTLKRIAALPVEAQAEMRESTGLFWECFALYEEGRYVKAVDLMERALDIRRRHLGKDDLDVATCTMNLAFLLRESDRLDKAEERFAEALETYRRLLGDQHPAVAHCVQNIAELRQLKGDYAEAERRYRAALATALRVLGDENANIALICGNLAGLLHDRGDYVAAEALYRKALAISRKVGGDRHLDVATCLNNIGTLLLDRGKRAEAEALYRQALQISRAFLGHKHPDVAVDLNNLAHVLALQGAFAEAERLHREALAIRQEAFGDEHSAVANSLTNLAMALRAKGDYTAAVLLCRRAEQIFRKSFGDEHPQLAVCRSNLGDLMYGLGDLETAEKLYRQALATKRKVLGDDHMSVAATLQNLGMLHYAKAEYEQAEATWASAARTFEAARRRVSARGLGRTEFGAIRSPWAALAACSARNAEQRLAWNRLEANLARGLLDALSARFARPLDPDDRVREESFLAELGRFDERIAAARAHGEVNEEASAALAELALERDELKAAFAEFQLQLADKYGPAAGEVYELTRIQRQLAPGAALVAWLDVKGDPQAADPSGEHWACVVRQEGNPAWIKLPGTGEGGTWTDDDDNLASRAGDLLSRPSGEPGVRAAVLRRLYAQRIAPLQPHLSGVQHLVVLPAGWMAGVPAEALTDEYIVSYAPSGTMFAWLRERTDETAGQRSDEGLGRLLALGDPNFKRSDLPSEPAAPRDASGPDAQASQPVPDLDALLLHTRGKSFVPLPGTHNEVEAIARLFRSVTGNHEPYILLGSNASEQNLDRLAASGQLSKFRLLHLATHGVMDDRIAMRSALILAQDRLPDSLEQVIAGQQVYDGRLTAEQIVRTWKLDADLVTLSGCRTALGKAGGGEGYLGFSQALFVAGARSLLLSLWKVDDTAAALLMTRFYENLLGAFDEPRKLFGRVYEPGDPLPKAQALREAKAWLRGLNADEVRTLCNAYSLPLPSSLERGTAGRMGPAEVPEHPFDHPYYWSAFILIGDPS